MCAKYPSVASRTPRFANDATNCRGLNTACGKGNGPSAVPNSATNPPSSVNTEVPKITRRQSGPPNPFSRCGIAEPSVNPPTSVPSAVPRSRRNHVAMAFRLGGYTNAMLAPVKNRTGSALAGPLHNKSAALISAAAPAAKSISRLRVTSSARFNSADARQPATNSSCTEIGGKAPTLGDKCHRARSCGSTADAENHAPMLNTAEPASTASARHLPGGSICAVESTVRKDRAYYHALSETAASPSCLLPPLLCRVLYFETRPSALLRCGDWIGVNSGPVPLSGEFRRLYLF